jgi:glycine betaine/choline ABC-type transport system substrate-binding protein
VGLGRAVVEESIRPLPSELARSDGTCRVSQWPLNYSGNPRAAVTALLNHEVDAADVYTTTPEIKADHLVVLADPKSLFRAENVVALVYKPALQSDPKIATILNYVSLRLTQPQLLALNAKAAQPGASLAVIATQWSRANVGAP